MMAYRDARDVSAHPAARDERDDRAREAREAPCCQRLAPDREEVAEREAAPSATISPVGVSVRTG